MAFNVRQIFAALNEAGVDYVVVGGLAVPLRSVDVFIDEPIGFDDLMAQSVVKDMEGLKVRIASIPHLIEMKRRAGRPRDLEDIDKLQQIHDAGRGDAR